MTRTAHGLEAGGGLDWRIDAACRGLDPSIWDLASGRDAYIMAHSICDDCPVRRQCEDFGRRTNAEGMIFGGVDMPNRHLSDPNRRKRIGFCAQCGNIFEGENSRQRFCGTACRIANWSKVR